MQNGFRKARPAELAADDTTLFLYLEQLRRRAMRPTEVAADKEVFFSYQVLSRRRATRPTEDGDTEVARTTPVVFFFKTAPLKTEAWSL